VTLSNYSRVPKKAISVAWPKDIFRQIILVLWNLWVANTGATDL
jgi:hypothetical protein